MGGRLNAYVHVANADGAAHVFGPEDKVPGWAAKLITNASAWAEEPEGQQSSSPEPPATPDPGTPDPGTAAEPQKVDYTSWVKADLTAEIEKRNAGREADDVIEPEGTKNADLIAALVADDVAQADDDNN